MSDPLTRFHDLFRDRCGLHFEGVAAARLNAAVETRRQHRKRATYWDYFIDLRSDEDEFHALLTLLTVNESYFFREPEQLRFLMDTVVPRLRRVGTVGQRPLRLLSAGCASGEEPYSLAIALAERYGPGWRRSFEIHAGDIDRTILARARTGRYSSYAFRGDRAGLRERYFEPSLDAWLLKQELRESVQFAELNLLDPAPLGRWQDFDIILFRNVSIYFDAPTRSRILRNLAAMLTGSGSLFVGSAETLANDLGVLPLIEEAGHFYFVQPVAAAAGNLDHLPSAVPAGVVGMLASGTTMNPALAAPDARGGISRSDVPPQRSGAATPMRPLPPEPAAVPDVADLRMMVAEERYEQAAPLLRARLQQHPGERDSLLLLAYLELNRMHWQASGAAAQSVLDADPWCVDALLLAALTAKGRGQTEPAIAHLRQAIYTQPLCWPAHFHLGNLYRERGQPGLSAQAYRRALQLLAAGPQGESGLLVIPLDLPPAKVRFLCEYRLQQLPSGAGNPPEARPLGRG